MSGEVAHADACEVRPSILGRSSFRRTTSSPNVSLLPVIHSLIACRCSAPVGGRRHFTLSVIPVSLLLDTGFSLCNLYLVVILGTGKCLLPFQLFTEMTNVYPSIDSVSPSIMATLDYVDIPSSAIRLESADRTQLRLAPKIYTSLPNPGVSPNAVPPPSSQFANPTSPTRSGINLQSMLLSSALGAVPAGTSSPRAQGNSAPKLMSTKDPLSLPITTANFKKFVATSGPVFWLQDRIEEIITWRLGWKYTSVWMSAYAFFCELYPACLINRVLIIMFDEGYFPRLVLLMPFVMVIGIILATDPSLKHPGPVGDYDDDSPLPSPTPLKPSEGSVDWLANLQGIQNLMGLTCVPRLFVFCVFSPLAFIEVI